jgi:hypothetical protein
MADKGLQINRDLRNLSVLCEVDLLGGWGACSFRGAEGTSCASLKLIQSAVAFDMTYPNLTPERWPARRDSELA